MGAIHYYEKERVFKLDTPHTSYLIGIVDEEKFLGHIYYGAKITDYDVRALMRTGEAPFVPSQNNRDRSSFLDAFPMEYPGHGVGDYRESAISVSDKNGNTAVQPLYREHKIYAGKPGLPGLPATFGSEEECETLEIVLADEVLDLTVTLYYTAFYDVDVITRSVRVTNHAKEPVYLTKVFSTALDLDAEDYRMLTLHGSWARERQIEYRQIGYGKQSVGSCRGESSHQEHPFVALVSANAGQEQGRVYGFHFVYSGNFLAQVEKNQFDSLRVVLGIHPQDFKWELKQGETFTAPEVVLTYSDAGLGRMTRTLHDLYRKHLIRSPYKDRERPVLINNWEATYFDFDTEKLLAIAREAKKSGIEMLVMDDGWFGKRNNDHCSLGDWFVNEEKLKGGLKPLVDRVNALGLKFGIWFEPEMISPDSELYRKHPDWCLCAPGRKPSIARFQYVLDMTREDVRDYLFTVISGVLSSANIVYLKWDFNRNLSEAGSALLPPERQQEFFHRYVLGLYDLLERLTSAFPHILFEGCSGGGGRFDPAMLYYSPQIWTSDDTDAIERCRIQYGTSMVYPASSISAHVSASPNHQTGRLTPFETRGNVAMAGAFGYELDLTKLTDEERALVRKQVAQYHAYYDIIQNGDLYRLVSPFENDVCCAWEYVSADRSEALLTFVVTKCRVGFTTFIRLRGLDPEKRYQDVETGRIYSGDTLMNVGVNLSRYWKDSESLICYFREVTE